MIQNILYTIAILSALYLGYTAGRITGYTKGRQDRNP